jgi:hypothetical protein
MTTEIIQDKVEFISDRDSGSNRQAYFQIVHTYGKFINFSIQSSDILRRAQIWKKSSTYNLTLQSSVKC